MSRETDSVVQLHRASGLGGRVTSITSDAPGRATGTYHQRLATPSPTDRAGVGLAVDFGDDSGDAKTATKMATFNLFVQANNLLIKLKKPGLAELFHSHASFFIKNGRQVPIAQLDRADFNRHKNHVHVAVPRGTFLVSPPAVVKAQTAAAQLPLTEDDMPKPNDIVFTIKTPSGKGRYKLGFDGGVFASGDAQFHGSYPGLNEVDPQKGDRRGFWCMELEIEGTGTDAHVTGYRLMSADGGEYFFNSAESERIAKLKAAKK